MNTLYWEDIFKFLFFWNDSMVNTIFLKVFGLNQQQLTTELIFGGKFIFPIICWIVFYIVFKIFKWFFWFLKDVFGRRVS